MESKFFWVSDSAQSLASDPDGKHLHWTTDINEELPIYMPPYKHGQEAPTTFIQLLQQTVLECPHKPALMVKKANKWITWTYQEYYSEALLFATSLISLGITQRKVVNIIGFNAPEWIFSFAGSVMANCIPTGIYTTSGTETCHYIADHSEAELIVTQNEAHLMKYLKVIDKLPKIKAFVVYWPTGSLKDINCPVPIYSWAEFLDLGANVDPAEVENRMNSIRPSTCMTIVYTSGTTGPPKGVLLSHDNYVWSGRRLKEISDPCGDDEHVISYLPLSHVVQQTIDFFNCLHGKLCIHFADEDALQGSLGQTIKEVRPTYFFGVPRVYEKFEEKIKAMFNSLPPSKKKIVAWAREVAYRNVVNLLENKPVEKSFFVAKAVFLDKLREMLGFDRCKVLMYGAAPLSRSTLKFFMSLNMPIISGYGMSETAAPMTFGNYKNGNIWSQGSVLPGGELVIMNSKNEILRQGEVGEICYRGRNKFSGYLKNEKETRECIDVNGFVHSGDEGYLDKDGFLFITGRIKELIITAGGENIPPFLIEEQIKDISKIFNTVLVVGEGKKYLAALISFKKALQPDGSFSEKLTPEVIEIFKAHGSPAQENRQALQCPIVKKYIQSCIEKYNKHASSRAQQIRKWGFLPQDLSIAGGELTPTMKVKRKVVHKKYEAAIEQLFIDPNL